MQPAVSSRCPRDVLHTFRNPGPGEARFLNIHAPGLGFERYLRGDFPGFDQHYQPAGSGWRRTAVTLLGPGEGERLELGESTRDDQGRRRARSALFEAEIGADFPRPPAHRHLKTAESFYVLERRVRR